MDWPGKKTKRALLRVTPEQHEAVSALAALQGRPVNWQYGELIKFALEHFLKSGVSGIRVPKRQSSATPGNRHISSAELAATPGNQRLPNQFLLPETGGPVLPRKRRSA